MVDFLKIFVISRGTKILIMCDTSLRMLYTYSIHPNPKV